MKALLVCLLLIHASAYAATPAYVASSFTCVNGIDDLQFASVAVSAGQTLVIGFTIATAGGTQVTSANFNTSESFTVVHELHNGNTVRGEMWRLLAPTATTANIDIVMSNTGETQACLVKFTNVVSFGTAVETSGDPGSATATCTSATGQLVIDVTAQRNNVEALGTAGAGQTAMGTSEVSPSLATGMSYESGAASTVMSWSNTMNQFANICVPLVGASSSTAGSTLRRRRR